MAIRHPETLNEVFRCRRSACGATHLTTTTTASRRSTARTLAPADTCTSTASRASTPSSVALMLRAPMRASTRHSSVGTHPRRHQHLPVHPPWSHHPKSDRTRYAHVTLTSHSCHTFITLTSHSCHANVSLTLHSCYPCVTFMLR